MISTEQFVAALTEYKLDPTGIAEVLWLALHQPRSEMFEASEPVVDDEDVDLEDGAADAETDESEQKTVDPPEQTGDDAAEEDNSFGLAPETPSGILPERALPISVPDAGFLDETLSLVRAMKPLLKQIESQLLSYVNEVATVERIAETDIWSPVMDPGYEPWFDVALVIDSSPAMSIWQRLIQDIQRLLRCYGSFRDFRVWQLVVTDGEPGLCAASSPEPAARSPKALLPPDARRLVLVFSDCTANYWWNGSLQPTLEMWGNATPTAIWQVLPDWMWKRTALGIGEYVTVRNHIPGTSNSKLTPVFLSLRSVARRRRQLSDPVVDAELTLPVPICVPVVTSEGESLEDWSRMLAGDRRASTPGFLLPPPTSVDKAQDNQPPEDVLDTFRLRATPSARRLAALLSAAPVITLPVMRLIRASDELLPGASPLPVAEVFLGGLLEKAPEQPDDIEPERVQYVLAEGVGDRLLDVLPKVDAVEVIEAVSGYVAQQLNCTLADFRALLLSPDLKDEADRYGLRSFATMTAQILRKVGPEFADLADQLEGNPENDNNNPEVDTGETDWLAGFTHATLTYQVAEYLNFPLLESFSFEQCEFVEDDVFPPPLSTEEFTIFTLERENDVEGQATPPLETFDITVATLVKVEDRWQVQTEQQQARRFIEPLPNKLTLEMVAIPGGSFTMGSPEAEAGHLDCEAPQHQVSVESLFMGRYPVTQAQWRRVAAMPQVERRLASSPSMFRRATLPVENISWYDAVEFCARLSVYTGRDYRLPTEAEWEYACRAETTTAFHFGDMITTEVANYTGSAYADGPVGKNRRQTTPVDKFGIANAYGLSDLHGNVFEWCQDHWHGNYDGAPTDGSAWLTNIQKERRIIRGGSLSLNPGRCRSACRFGYAPTSRDSDVGFRVSCRVLMAFV